jgi:hypothetical protein
MSFPQRRNAEGEASSQERNAEKHGLFSFFLFFASDHVLFLLPEIGLNVRSLLWAGWAKKVTRRYSI